jgi:DNA modification methylase
VENNALNIAYVAIDTLKPYEKNARTHSDAQIAKIADSIKQFGFNDPIAIDGNGCIIAGHGRVMAAKLVGLTDVPTIQLGFLTEENRRAYILAHNRLALDAGWDSALLEIEMKELQEAGFDLAVTGFTQEEIDVYCQPTKVENMLADDDDVPDFIHQPVSCEGDVWLLGNHRLMCGDATVINNIDLLMNGNKADLVFTDPPYNTGMTSEKQKGSGGLWKGNGSARLSHMFNDSYSPEEWQIFMSSFMTSYWMLMKDDSVAYICLDWRRNHELIPHIEKSGFHRSNLIVWDKMVHGLGSDYKYTYELINVCKKGKPTLSTHQGVDAEYSDVWHIQRKMGKNDDHATAKPIELMERAIRHASNPGYIIADLFGGSGSTLIACEKTNRKCYMMEISPSYVDVIIHRWQTYTGKKAILENNGMTFEDVANERKSSRTAA